MAYRCKYPPLPDPPHLTRPQLVERLSQRLGAEQPDGHRFWHGSHTRDTAIMRLRTPDGTALLTVRRMVWWLAHGVWLPEAETLAPRCGQPRCVALAHLRTASKTKDLTTAQVAEARRLYMQGLCDADHDGIRRTSPVAMTAWQLGLAADTVRRVIAGRPVATHLWLTEEVNADRVREVHAGKVEVARARLAQSRGRWTSNRLADHFGVTRSKMADALGTLTSRRAQVGAAGHRPTSAPLPPWTPPPPPPPRGQVPARRAPEPAARERAAQPSVRQRPAARSTSPYGSAIVPVCRKRLAPTE